MVPTNSCPLTHTASTRATRFAHPLIEFQLELSTARLARCSSALDRNYLPSLALQDIPEFVVKDLTIGRRHLQAECVVSGRHDLASDLQWRGSHEMGQKLSLAIFHSPGGRHDTCSIYLRVAHE